MHVSGYRPTIERKLSIQSLVGYGVDRFEKIQNGYVDFVSKVSLLHQILLSGEAGFHRSDAS